MKLHKSHRVWLGERSHLIPITGWQVGKVQVRNWISLLTVPSRCYYPNNVIRYVTLVQVPTDHPVELGGDWACGWSGRYVPLREADAEVKQWLGEWTETWSHPELPTDSPRPRCGVPQLILGAPLPRNFIKWTKDVRLLYHGKRNRQRRLQRHIQD